MFRELVGMKEELRRVKEENRILAAIVQKDKGRGEWS